MNRLEKEGSVWDEDVAWFGQWIGPKRVDLEDNDSLAGRIPTAGFSRTLARRQFILDVAPASAPVRLTADSRYVLYVNGREASRGPSRYQPLRMSYDTVDIAEYLQSGANVIAVVISYYGRANAYWQPAEATGTLGADAGLVFEGNLGEVTLGSDDSWRMLRVPGWSIFPLSSVDAVPRELVDARGIPARWHALEFDDSSWAFAATLGVDHLGGFGRSIPPTAPYGQLHRSTTTPLASDTHWPMRCRKYRELEGARSVDWHPGETAVRMLSPVLAAAEHVAFPVSGESDSAWGAELDFGRVVSGLVAFEIDAPAGTIVDFHFRERALATDSPVPDAAEGMRYVARGRDDVYESLEPAGFRYVYAVVHQPSASRVTLRSLTLVERTYPWTGAADFTSNDPVLDRIYRAGVRTVQLNSTDAFTDCPTREMRSWVGDAVVHQMVHLTTNNDWGLAAHYPWLAASPRPDGLLPMGVAGDLEFDAGLTIPDYSLQWIHALHNLFLYRGLPAVQDLLPVASRVLAWFAQYADGQGILTDVPEWTLVDWSSVMTGGRSGVLTALWGRALREYATMAAAADDHGSARWATAHWERAYDGFEVFWDETRGVYVDGIDESATWRSVSQAGCAAAIVSGFAPRDRWDRISVAIMDPKALATRSWIVGPAGGYDPDKIAEQLQRLPDPDWNVHTQIVRAQPFISYVLHDALAQAQRTDLLLENIRSWQDLLEEGYDTLSEGWGWGTPAHGWSASPTRDLIQHIAGIRPDSPGFTRARIAPRPAGLDEMFVTAPSPAGDITVNLKSDHLAVQSPLPFVLSLDGRDDQSFAPGRHDIQIEAHVPNTA